MLEVSDRLHDDGDAVLDEVDRLPEGYRLAVLLCDLEGLTSAEAAHRLGWPVGTVRSRLARGRDRLRDRLTRRGLAPSATVPALLKSFDLVPAALDGSTVRAAMALSSGVGLGSGAFPASVAALVSLASRSLLMAKLQWATAGLLAIGVASLGAAGFARQQPTPTPAPVPGGVTATSPTPFETPAATASRPGFGSGLNQDLPATATSFATQPQPATASGMPPGMTPAMESMMGRDRMMSGPGMSGMGTTMGGDGMMEGMMGGAGMMGSGGMGMMMGGMPGGPPGWEYTTWNGSAQGTELVDACNRLGAEGWELSSSLSYGDSPFGEFILIFKRPQSISAQPAPTLAEPGQPGGRVGF